MMKGAGWTNPVEKSDVVKLDHFPKPWGEYEKWSKITTYYMLHVKFLLDARNTKGHQSSG